MKRAKRQTVPARAVIGGIVKDGVIVPDSVTGLEEGARVGILLPIDITASERQEESAELNQCGAGDSRQSPGSERNAWDVLEALAGTVEAPEDWSAEHDHYLYGTPKRHDIAKG